MQTTYSVNDLAARWGLSPQAVRQMETDGKLHRLPEMPGVKFAAAEVHQLESIGRDAQPLTAWERKQLESKVAELEAKVMDLTDRLCKIQQITLGG